MSHFHFPYSSTLVRYRHLVLLLEFWRSVAIAELEMGSSRCIRWGGRGTYFTLLPIMHKYHDGREIETYICPTWPKVFVVMSDASFWLKRTSSLHYRTFVLVRTDPQRREGMTYSCNIPASLSSCKARELLGLMSCCVDKSKLTHQRCCPSCAQNTIYLVL